MIVCDRLIRWLGAVGLVSCVSCFLFMFLDSLMGWSVGWLVSYLVS